MSEAVFCIHSTLSGSASGLGEKNSTPTCRCGVPSDVWIQSKYQPPAQPTLTSVGGQAGMQRSSMVRNSCSR